MPQKPVSKWYAIRTVSRGEFKADAELAEAGLERFTPIFHRNTLIRRTKGRYRVPVAMPLLPGYLFAPLDFSARSHHMAALDGCKHVLSVVRTVSGIPVPVRLKELQALRMACESGIWDEGHKRGYDNRFAPGDRVRITSGPWAGMTVTFRTTAGGMYRPRVGCVKVMFDRLFGASMEIDVPQDLLEAA